MTDAEGAATNDPDHGMPFFVWEHVAPGLRTRPRPMQRVVFATSSCLVRRGEYGGRGGRAPRREEREPSPERPKVRRGQYVVTLGHAHAQRAFLRISEIGGRASQDRREDCRH
jgi:hypothetical protein